MGAPLFLISDSDVLDLRQAFKRKDYRKVNQIVSRNAGGHAENIPDSVIDKWIQAAATLDNWHLKIKLETELVGWTRVR